MIIHLYAGKIYTRNRQLMQLIRVYATNVATKQEISNFLVIVQNHVSKWYLKVDMRIIFYETILALFRGKGNVHHWLWNSFIKYTNTLSLRLRCNSTTSLVLGAYLFPVLVMFNSYYTRTPPSTLVTLLEFYVKGYFYLFLPSF